jgi:Tol biopolymer transport system component
MSSILRTLGTIILLSGIIIILGCGKDKTTQPKGNHAPNAPSNPSPVHLATGVSTNVTLTWQCSDTDGDTIKYDIYLDTLSNPSLAVSNHLETSYQPSINLRNDKAYYWKVVAKDEHGAEAASAIWRFTTTPPTNGGQIAFVSYRDSDYEIYVMNADGTNQHNVTSNSGSDANPSFSYDGTKIVFRSERDNDADDQIYVMNFDGSNQHNVTNDSADSHWPAWSPDGTQIAFYSGCGSIGIGASIYVMNSNGMNKHSITDCIAFEGVPTWSPQGTQIAFAVDSLYYSYSAIYIMNADGSNLHKITDHLNNDFDPTWSHDGTKIVFASERAGHIQIYVMNADGSNQHNISNSSSYDLEPCWSPDDSQIAFTSDREGNNDVFVMDADGSNQHNVSNNPASDYDPSWAPIP